jgi:hypothetical protein
MQTTIPGPIFFNVFLRRSKDSAGSACGSKHMKMFDFSDKDDTEAALSLDRGTETETPVEGVDAADCPYVTIDIEDAIIKSKE